jgi:isopentenyl diphosphate isomerase/L-lactate dehydrogenase-like FMN-dependent dehydrogenase
MKEESELRQAERDRTRRRFLRFLAASPAIASLGGVAAFLGEEIAHSQGQTQPADASAKLPDAGVHYPLPWEFPDAGRNYNNLITNPAQALDVFDFEEPMHHRVGSAFPGHWAYFVTGTFSEGTLHANRAGFQHVFLRPRRLMKGVTGDANTKVTIFGETYDAPIFTCPTEGQRNVWMADGELSVSRACKARNTQQMLSWWCSQSPEDCSAALGRPVIMQIYPPTVYSNTQIALKRLEAAGVKTIELTVDAVTGRNTETQKWFVQNIDTSTCAQCHTAMNGQVDGSHKGADLMEKGFNMSKDLPISPLDWDYVDRVRQDWKGKLGIKGILTREDAALCIRHGIDFVYVSNHGGREAEAGMSTIQVLPGIAEEVKGKVPIFIDSGFRRGTDVFKALALGATAVGIGHPMLWGLGAFGEPGVAKVLEILQYELKMTMGNVGTAKVADINANYVECDWNSPLPVTG